MEGRELSPFPIVMNQLWHLTNNYYCFICIITGTNLWWMQNISIKSKIVIYWEEPSKFSFHQRLFHGSIAHDPLRAYKGNKIFIVSKRTYEMLGSNIFRLMKLNIPVFKCKFHIIFASKIKLSQINHSDDICKKIKFIIQKSDWCKPFFFWQQ